MDEAARLLVSPTAGGDPSTPPVAPVGASITVGVGIVSPQSKSSANSMMQILRQAGDKAQTAAAELKQQVVTSPLAGKVTAKLTVLQDEAKEVASSLADRASRESRAVAEEAVSAAAEKYNEVAARAQALPSDPQVVAALQQASVARDRAVATMNVVKEKAIAALPPEVKLELEQAKAKFEALELKLKAVYEEKLAQAKQEVTDYVETRMDRVLDEQVRPLIHRKAVDSWMPPCVQGSIEDGVNAIWPDVKEEFWSGYYGAALKWEPVPDGFIYPWTQPLNKLRAFLLHTLYPHNASIWKRLHSFWWWFFTLVRVFPSYGVPQIFFLVAFFLHDLRDEYRLVSFILEIKAFQFIQIGVVQAVIGGVQYFSCVNLQSTLVTCVVPSLTGLSNLPERTTHSCAIAGPGSMGFFYGDMAFFLAQTVLVWICFLLLPCSQKKGVRRLAEGSARHRFHVDVSAGSDIGDRIDRNAQGCCGNQQGSCCCGCKLYQKRGGHLRRLLAYDVVVDATQTLLLRFLNLPIPFSIDGCFDTSECVIQILALLMGGLVVLALFTRTDSYAIPSNHFNEWEWQFKADLYWIRVGFAILSVPFAIFGLPVLSQLLLHIRPTGYNRQGVCVPVVDPPPRPQSSAKVAPLPHNSVATNATNHNGKSNNAASASVAIDMNVVKGA